MEISGNQWKSGNQFYKNETVTPWQQNRKKV